MSRETYRLQGHRVKLLREKLGLTQAELGERVGVNDKQIIRYEKETHDPLSQTVALLVIALETNSDYLLGLSDDASPHLSEESLTFLEKIALLLRNGDKLGAIKLISDQDLSQWAQHSKPQKQKT